MNFKLRGFSVQVKIFIFNTFHRFEDIYKTFLCIFKSRIVFARIAYYLGNIITIVKTDIARKFYHLIFKATVTIATKLPFRSNEPLNPYCFCPEYAQRVTYMGIE